MKENEKPNLASEPAGAPAEKTEQEPGEECAPEQGGETRSEASAVSEMGGPDLSALADASVESSSLELEKPPEAEVERPEGRTGPEVGLGKEEVAQEDFQPFYEKEARAETRTKAVKSIWLYFLLGFLGLTLIGLALDAVWRGAPFWLEAAVTAVICFTLIGLLWKTITLETKVGLEALAVWVIAAAAVLFYGQNDLGPGGFIPGGFVLPGLFALALAAVLTAVWLVWPRLFWPPLLLTAVVLYAGLAPALALSMGGMDLNSLLLGPPGMDSWPIFVRAGYVAVQVVLPLGLVLFLALQVRTLFNRRYRTHWGFLYWALALVLAGVIGLVGLDRNRQPVFPPLAGLTARLAPIDQAEPGSASTAPTEIQPEAASPEQPASVREPAPPAPSVPPAETPKESEREPAGPTTAGQKEKPGSAEVVTPSAPPPPAESEIVELKARIESLEDRIKELTERLATQDELLKAIMNYIGAESEKPSPPEIYEPDRAEPPETEPQDGERPVAPPEGPPRRIYQDYT